MARGPTATLILRIAAALAGPGLAAAAILGLVGCAGSGPGALGRGQVALGAAAEAGSTSATRSGATPSAVATPDGATPDGATPDGVALVATRAWLSYDTRIDRRPNDTARRLALPWLDPVLRQAVLSFSGSQAPGSEWTSWTARHAYATVAVMPGSDDHPPDSSDTAWRQVLAVVTLHGDGGWTASQRHTEFLQLRLVDGHWLVADLRAAATDPVT